MAGRIATVSGTMLVPGVSRNGRLYTPELIAAAAKRMQGRIADPDGLPITVRTHHDAGDDSARIVGRITTVAVEKDGRATYSADLYDTAHGRDIASLVVPARGQPPALKSVSIHGYWIGPVKRVTYEGQSVTTGDDLEIDSVDFTGTPGVPGATIASASYVPADAPAESTGRMAISETLEALVEAVQEEVPPIRSRAAVRRAAREATTPEARLHVAARARALGHLDLIPPHWMEDGSMQETTRYSDIREYYPDGPAGAAGFCIDAYNGPTSLTLRSCGLDPAELRVIAAAAMQAAVDALAAMDPDMDGDIDVDGAPNADGDAGEAADDDQMESAPQSGTAVAETAEQSAAAPVEFVVDMRGSIADDRDVAEAVHRMTARLHTPQTTPPAPAGAASTTKEEPAVSEPTTETAAPARSLTDADLTALAAAFSVALKETLAPPATAPKAQAEETAETAPAQPKADKAAKKALKESRRLELAALKESLLAEVRDELRAELLKENGLPQRQGYRVHENDQAPEPVEDLFARRAELLLGDYAKVPQPQ